MIEESKKILASQYYIENQMSIAQIAKRLLISEKTLFIWKKENGWEDKRTRFLKSQYSCNQTLYELLHLVANKAVEDFKLEGIMPDQKTLYFIMNMAGKLKDLKTFETQTANEKAEELKEVQQEQNEDKKTSTNDLLAKIFKAMSE